MIPDETLKALKRLGTCMVSNAIEQFDVRLRNEGFADATIRCMFPHLPPMVGYAVTARIRCSGPPPEGHAILERTDWWDAISRIPAPRVFVVQDMDRVPGRGALLGGVHANILMALDCVGAVTNGAVRDLNQVGAMGFQFFAHNPAVSHSYAHIIEIGGAVEIGGLQVAPGDLLHGDEHGVLCIPKDIAAKIPEAADRLSEKERKIIELCGVSEFSIERLRAVVEEAV
jgi:4-hydroxy-4-methyl-2-oxoglutarate aldolase